MNTAPEKATEEHGHKKEYTIFVNTRKKIVTKHELTFHEVVALAFDPIPPGAHFTVTYRRADGQEGSLLPGHKVKVTEDMAFDVTETGQS